MKKYQELTQHLIDSIERGAFQVGERLPSIRSLAQEHNLARLTVERALLELEKKGCIIIKPGSGSYVSQWKSEAEEKSLPSWQEPFQNLSLRTREEEILYPLHRGAGAPDLLPRGDFIKSLRQELSHGDLDMGYGEAQGARELRKRICQLLSSRGLSISPSSILVTTGSQQAISLILRTLLVPGDSIVLGQPGYAAVRRLCHSMGLDIQGVPLDQKGMEPQALEDCLKSGNVKLIYLMPTHQNPRGITMDGPRRREILGLAEKYQVPILEDDYLGGLDFQPSGNPTLRAMDRHGWVIYVSTFSKILLPGLRLGFLSVDGPVLDQLLERKIQEDLASPYFLQQALARYITLGRYQAHLKTLRREYQMRLNSLLEGLGQELTGQWTIPSGGLYLWGGLPRGVDSNKLLEQAAKKGLAFAPGREFFHDPEQGRAYMRLNFTQLPPEENLRAGEIIRTLLQRN